MTYCHALAIPAQGVIKFTILVDPSLVIITIYMYLLCLNHAPEERRKLFKEIHQFYTFYPKITSPWGGCHEFTISCLLTLQLLHTKFG